MNRWITQLRKGVLEFCLINLLDERESYGYEIVQKLKSLDELSITESTVYPILTRMRKEGYLDVKTKSSNGGPPRHYFYLTKLGKQRVKDMNNYWGNLNRSINKLTRG